MNPQIILFINGATRGVRGRFLLGKLLYFAPVSQKRQVEVIWVEQRRVHDLGGQASRLARLAVVYADRVRMKIVTEAYMREMSPTVFFDEFGGGSLPRVSQHFEKLAMADWLWLERTETGGQRRGGVEHFYRAKELVIFEDETWAALPASMRASFSWVTFEQLTERASAALVAETFNARPDRHLSWTPILLDQIGWKRLIAKSDIVFRTVLEEQSASERRLAAAKQVGFLATAAIAVFESPTWLWHVTDQQNQRYRPAITGGPSIAINSHSFFPMLAKACSNPLDLLIIDELNRGEMSAKTLQETIEGLDLTASDRRLKKLARNGWAGRVRQESGGRRRGGTEHFYRAVGPALIDNKNSVEIPDEIQQTISSNTFEHLRTKVKEAIAAGTFDARLDRHLTWSLIHLDQLRLGKGDQGDRRILRISAGRRGGGQEASQRV